MFRVVSFLVSWWKDWGFFRWLGGIAEGEGERGDRGGKKVSLVYLLSNE
jgi:hypothetical protein